ncbi:MAG: rod shape-determining protein MreC [Patescibacteria group bacterium]|nr:rod shape-determining protein MreC [Patescibacteria group bacterium]
MRYSLVKTAIISVLFIAFIFALNLTPLAKWTKNFIYSTSCPIQGFFWETGDTFSDFFKSIFSAKDIKQELDRVKIENQKLVSENLSLKSLKNENESLRQAVGNDIQKEFQILLSHIIGIDVSGDFILINKGSRDGVLENMPIINAQKVLCGRINNVYANFSKVILLSNKKSVFDAKISENATFGLVKGKGNFKLFFDLMPQEKEIKKGDIIVTTSSGGIFPEGLLVGEIEKIQKKDVELFQKADIKPFFNIQEANELFIITNY